MLQLQYTLFNYERKVEYPPPRFNFNVLFTSARLADYGRKFSSDEEERQVRFFAETAKLDHNSRVLDFGAGLGGHLLVSIRAGVPPL